MQHKLLNDSTVGFGKYFCCACVKWNSYYEVACECSEVAFSWKHIAADFMVHLLLYIVPYNIH